MKKRSRSPRPGERLGVVGALPGKRHANPARRRRGANPTRPRGCACPAKGKAKGRGRNPAKACPVPRTPKGKLSTASREKLPTCAFADPAGRRFPIHDEGHVRAALPRLYAEKKRGNVSAKEFPAIEKRIREAMRRLGEGKKPLAANAPAQEPKAKVQETAMKKRGRGKRRSKATRKLKFGSRAWQLKYNPRFKAAAKRPAARKAPKRRKVRAAAKPASRRAAKRTAAGVAIWGAALKKKAAAARRVAARKAARTRARRKAEAETRARKVAAPRKKRAKKAARKAARRMARKVAAPRRKRAKKAARKVGRSRKRVYTLSRVKRPRRVGKVSGVRRKPRRSRVVQDIRTGRRYRMTRTRRRNPLFTMTNMLTFGGTTILGRAVAELVDRLVATMPASADALPSTGVLAIEAYAKNADWKRMLASGGPTLAFGVLGAVLASYGYTGWASASFGMTLGYFLKFGPQVAGKLGNMAVAKLAPDTSPNSWLFRLLPEWSAAYQSGFTGSAANYGPRALGVGAGRGAPASSFQIPGAAGASPKAQAGPSRQERSVAAPGQRENSAGANRQGTVVPMPQPSPSGGSARQGQPREASFAAAFGKKKA